MRAITAGILLVVAGHAFGAKEADQEIEKLLARMREAYSGAKTARVTVKTTGLRFGKDTIVSDMTYMKERKIYTKISGNSSFPGRSRLFISDGVKVQVDDLSGNTQLSDFNLDFIPFPINLEAMSFWDWKRQLSTAPGANMNKSVMKLKKGVKWNGKDWLVLEETAHEQGVYVDYHIDPKTAFIHRVQVYDLKKKELRTEMVVSRLEINPRVDAKIFKLKAKGGPTSIRKRIEKKIDF
ncbi:MAG: hypothetical protein H7Y17_06570 [Chlorobia bacterium]|nr:hypothetical protein [Fimbriimonadaceae bacterium]